MIMFSSAYPTVPMNFKKGLDLIFPVSQIKNMKGKKAPNFT